MLITYPALFHKEDGSYWVEFPDLEGCQSFGDTLNETIVSAQEALTGYILTLLEDGVDLVEPSDIKKIATDENSFTSLITSDISRYLDTNVKAVKKTLTIPAWLNERAIKKDINFSRVLQEALIEELEIVK